MVRQEYSITLGEVGKVLVVMDERAGEILWLRPASTGHLARSPEPADIST
jgi:hypothetical protein